MSLRFCRTSWTLRSVAHMRRRHGHAFFHWGLLVCSMLKLWSPFHWQYFQCCIPAYPSSSPSMISCLALTAREVKLPAWVEWLVSWAPLLLVSLSPYKFNGLLPPALHYHSHMPEYVTVPSTHLKKFWFPYHNMFSFYLRQSK